MMSSSVYSQILVQNISNSFYIYAKDDRNNKGIECLKIHKNLDEIRAERDNIDITKIEGTEAKGVLGLLKCPQGMILVVVKQRTLVNVILGHEIYCLNGVETFCSVNPILSPNEIIYLERFASLVKDYFNNTPNFFFSYTFNLSANLQLQIEKSTNKSGNYIYDNSIPHFVWNYSLLKELDKNETSHQFFLPIIHGFIGHCNVETNGGTCQFFLISRRSTERAGTRFFKRGVNSEGYVANFVESEHIFVTPNDIFTYTQVRGSIPIEWTQVPNLSYNPPIIIHNQNNDSRFKPLLYHFNRLKVQYKDFIIVNLINKSGREKKLGDAFYEGIQKYFKSYASLKYFDFDFHKECKNMNWKALYGLIQQISSPILRMNYFHCSKNFDNIISHQTGVVRTNCIDCLDRTNVLQSMISRYVLDRQMNSIGMVPINPKKMHYDMNNLWADNADSMSIQYSGTPALKTDFTRFGTRTILGVLFDGYYSIKRYYLNNFFDGYRQDQIDLTQKRHPIFYDYTFKKDRKPSFLVSFVSIFCLISLISILHEVLYANHEISFCLKNISIWTTFLLFGLFYVKKNSQYLISFPQSYYFYNDNSKKKN